MRLLRLRAGFLVDLGCALAQLLEHLIVGGAVVRTLFTGAGLLHFGEFFVELLCPLGIAASDFGDLGGDLLALGLGFLVGADGVGVKAEG
ncbi:hypothetical protein [Pseudomonas sp. SCB32]|uniref:hypothetical protein n=1 Tax=Pseudomonas sp. SCB32 TaxID=2653853 RepID=UPI0015B57E26|nr:hypothetical protein [Pseudomonas sp. SCB32]